MDLIDFNSRFIRAQHPPVLKITERVKYDSVMVLLIKRILFKNFLADNWYTRFLHSGSSYSNSALSFPIKVNAYKHFCLLCHPTSFKNTFTSLHSPAPSISWRRVDNVPFPRKVDMRKASGVLEIPYFQQEDAGTYECVAENSRGMNTVKGKLSFYGR